MSLLPLIRYVLVLVPLVAAGALAGPAAAQLRPGLPDVQAPASRPDLAAAESDRAWSRFRAWSEARGRPAMLVFWNRELSDDTTTRTRDRTTGQSTVAAAPGVTTRTFDVVSEAERTTGGRHAALGGPDAEALETAFFEALLRSGAQVLDRNALMRKVSTVHTGADRADQQFLEAVALEQGVQYLIEILPEPRASSPTGLSFNVKITHLPTARVHARFRTEGLPAAGPSRLVAAPGGYQRRREDRNTPEGVGAQLATETVSRF